MPTLQIVTTSTREQRAGAAVAQWFTKRAQEHGKFELQTVDLKELNLPLLDEPNHPIKRQYQFEHTKRWSKLVSAADAFVFVTPEYNFGMPPALLNALDYLYHEWNYKPAAFVSYGGASGGLRSVQMSKSVLTTLKMMPIPEGVSIPFFTQHLKDGVFDPGDAQTKPVTSLLDELLRWSNALETLRR